ncbi:MAG: hypothetical protein R3F62_11240 [Planctomycetota bacterium]
MDEQLRGLSRGGDDPEQAARYLRAALRAGEVDPERVALAAHLGHPAARRALDRVDPPASLRAWILDFRAFGQQVFVRMQCAALGAALPADRARREALGRILAACEAWATDPCPDTQQTVEDVIVERLTPSLQETVALRQNPAAWQIVDAARTAATLTRPGWEPEVAIPVTLPPDAPEVEGILARLRKAGTQLEWARRGEGWVARLSDCGFVGAGGLAQALAPLCPLKPMEILGLARPFRERAAPALFAARLAGEVAVRDAIEHALSPDLGL